MLRADLALIVVTIIWGATFVVVKNTIEDVSVVLFLALRFTLATLCVLAFYRGKLSGAWTGKGESIRGGILAGTCLIGGYVLQTFGLRYTTPSISAFITGMTTVMVPFLSALVYRTVPHPSEGLGAVVATAGLALLSLRGERLSLGIGETLTLGCTVLYACHILVLGRFARQGNIELLSVVQLGSAAGLALAACWWVETPRMVVSTTAVVGIVVTGLLATALGFSVQAWAQQHTTPTRVALIFALEPVSAMITSYLQLGERLAWRGVAGAALILCGILIAELKPIGSVRHPVD